MHAEPQAEHRWLEKLVGEWTYVNESIMEPGQPPIRLEGTDVVRSIGGLWIQREGRGDMPGGGTAKMLFTLGYDPAKGRFVGTFVASVMTYLWIYDGELDASGNVLTLNAEGPGFSGDGAMAKYQDIFEIHDDDSHTLSSQVLGEDGAWNKFMTAHYRRVK